ESPFYATGGGQVADTGLLALGGWELPVLEVTRRGSRLCHRVALPAGLSREALIAELGALPLEARVDAGRRQAIARAHTATHLLHAALHAVVGEEATQAGSWVGPDSLRFDFNHYRALRVEELVAVEQQVGEWVLANLPVRHETLPIAAAMARGAMALFGEKYGEEVRVVSVGEVSLELCGGTHLVASGAIGQLLITAEGSVASGVRRLEALTGLAAQRAGSLSRRTLSALAQRLHVAPEQAEESLADLIEERQRLRRDLEALRAAQAAARSEELLAPAGSFGGIAVLRGELKAEQPKELRRLADSLRGKLNGALAVLLAEAGGKSSFLLLVPDGLAAAGLHAGRLAEQVAQRLGGRGGGSATLAQAGLSGPEQFAAVLAALGETLAAQAGGES
ncbi:alanine--tRNA ligase, partial [bacterium]|nr:alanine--tRNA ligase [bacterium]